MTGRRRRPAGREGRPESGSKGIRHSWYPVPDWELVPSAAWVLVPSAAWVLVPSAAWVDQQVHLSPYPKELVLRNHI